MGLLGAMPGAIAQGLVWGVMSIGVYITYKILDIADLTVDGSICTGAAVCAMMAVSGVNIWICILCAFVVGMLAGLVTGLFHTALGIPAILSGILTQLMLWSINLKIMGKANQVLPARSVSVLLTQMNNVRAVVFLVIALTCIICLLYWFFGTELGSSLRATGCNLNMARAQGINTNFNKVLGLMLSNGLVGLSGAFLAQYQGFADINMGRGAIVIGLAAVIIGEALFSSIAKNFAIRLATVAVGSVIYFVVYQTVIFLGLDTDLLKMLSALVVAVFLGTPYLKENYFPAARKKEGNKNA